MNYGSSTSRLWLTISHLFIFLLMSCSTNSCYSINSFLFCFYFLNKLIIYFKRMQWYWCSIRAFENAFYEHYFDGLNFERKAIFLAHLFIFRISLMNLSPRKRKQNWAKYFRKLQKFTKKYSSIRKIAKKYQNAKKEIILCNRRINGKIRGFRDIF